MLIPSVTFTPIPSNTLKPSETKTSTPTQFLTKTASPSPSATLSPTATPTIDVAKAVTFTPAAPAICPEDDPNVTVPNLYDKDSEDAEIVILETLNNGGIKQLLEEMDCQYSSVCLESQIASTDITGDGVPELILSGGIPIGRVFVFGCEQGQYVTLLREPAIYDTAPEIIVIEDMNLNGMNDLVIKQVTCHYCFAARVYEWDENQFSSLVWEEIYPGSGEYHDLAELNGYGAVYVDDLDSNGITEIVLEGGIPSWFGGTSGNDGPYRSQTIVYTWNGENYISISKQYEAPRFRFEAVQDGDVASERGDYDKAMTFYHDTIYSDTLKSWTYDVWFGTFTDPEYECCSPPDINEMPFNEIEYSQLAAYSWYRIMLLHLLRGQENDAQIVYKTLLDEYSIENAGYPYVQLATEFWSEYQVSQDILLACDKAIMFAEQNEGILIPLGNNHGMFSRYYKPEMVCPFK
jgi:hypothetical protein